MPVDECVQQILSKKLGKGEKPSDQDLAIAFSECREKTQKIAQIKNSSRILSAQLSGKSLNVFFNSKKKRN